MFDTVSAHVELIEGNNILREVVADIIIRAKLTADRFLRCQQISDLNIQLFAALVTYEINFLIARSADSYFIAPAQQFQIHDIFQNEIDVPHIAAENSLADAVIGNIILLIGGKYLLSLQIFPLHLIEQISLAAVSDIVQNRLRGNSALFVFQKLRKRDRRESHTHIGNHIGNDPFKQVNIPDFIPLYDVLELDRVKQVVKILLGRSICVAEVCKVGHTSGKQIFLKTLLNGRIGHDRTVQFHELSKGKRIDHKLHIPSAQIGCKLTRQQLCIGAGDIDVAIQRNAERIDALFPVLDLLNLIKKQIDLAVDLLGAFGDLIMQRLRGLQMGVAHILKVDGDKLCWADAGLREFLLDQLQHDRLSAAADTGHDLD